MRRFVFAGWLLAVCVLGPTCPAEAAREEMPLPVAKTSLCKDRTVVYIVDGKQRIPPGVEITLQKGVQLKGKNDAVLSVAGSFVAHGVTGSEVMISTLKIVVEPKAKQIHIDKCTAGKGVDVYTEKGQSAAADVTIENSDFDGATVDLAMHAGKVKIMSSKISTVLKLTGVRPEGKKTRSFASIRTSRLDGIEAVGLADITIRHCELRSVPVLLRDNTICMLDGNRVIASHVDIEQAVPKALKKTTITKNDFVGGTIRVFAPLEAGKKTSVTMDKCWFSNVLDMKVIAKLVKDREDDPTNAVKILVKKPMKRPHDFAPKIWN